MIAIFLILAWLSVRHTHAYTVPAGATLVFPVQVPNDGDPRTFTRLNGDDVEVLSCPSGFVFSNTVFKCVIDSVARFATRAAARTASETRELSTPECPSEVRGAWPNINNCRTFLNCWDGTGYETDCTSYLLFSASSGYCDWPQTADCCEYREKNSSRIVQSV